MSEAIFVYQTIINDLLILRKRKPTKEKEIPNGNREMQPFLNPSEKFCSK
jgi:hypothetical protein